MKSPDANLDAKLTPMQRCFVVEYLLTWEQQIADAHTIHYADSATPNSRLKPTGIARIEIYVAYALDRVPPPEEARYIRSYTTSPFTVDVSDRRPVAWAFYYGKWANASGDTGPWSEPLRMPM